MRSRLKQLVADAAVTLLLIAIALGLTNCGLNIAPSQPAPAPSKERELCYAKADAHAAARAYQECLETGWAACPSRDAIKGDQAADYAKCP